MRPFLALSRASLKELLRNPLTTGLGLLFPMTFILMFFMLPDLPMRNGKTVSALAFGLPAVFLFCALSLGLSGTAAPMAQDRKDGVLRNIGMTPVSKAQYLLAQLPSRVGIIIIELLLIIGVAALSDGFHPGRPWHVLLGLLLAVTCSLSLGLLLGSSSSNPGLVGGVAGFVGPALMFVCGIFLPYRMMPGWVETIGRLLPFTYIADMLRVGITGIDPDYPLFTGVWVSLLWTIVLFVAAFATFRWDRS